MPSTLLSSSYRRHRLEAAAEDLVDVHLGHALGRLIRVVVTLGVNHQRLQHFLHLGLHLGLQLGEFALTHEGRDVVVGVVAAIGGDQSIADALGRRQRGPWPRLILLCQQ